MSNAACYKCGKNITQGTTNWSYNTHRPGAFAHKNCYLAQVSGEIKTEEKRTEEVIKPIVEIPNKTEEIKTPVISDITDKITLADKHKLTRTIRTLLKLREYPFLYGAPGAGKTHLCESLAADMGLDFLCISLAPDMFKSEITGSVSPVSGNYISTEFYEQFKNGGVILFDECGLASGSFLNVLNAALAQKELRFPNRERIKMHKDCFIMFADNSNLRGNDPNFPERQDVGTAFRDRLSYVEFEYDEALEFSILRSINPTQANSIYRKVLALRKCLKENQVIGVYASPRFGFKTAKLMSAGMTFEECIKVAMLAGCDEDTNNVVMSCVRNLGY